MIIRKQDTTKYSRAGMSGEYYQLENFRNGTTYALAKFTAEHGERTTGSRPRIYFLIKGSARFLINGEEQVAGPHDLVIIPPETTYNFWPTNGEVEVFAELEYLDVAKLPK